MKHKEISSSNLLKSFLFVLTIIMLLVSITGCKIGTKNDDKNTLADQNFRSGTSGLTMKWVEESIPKTIYDTSTAQEEISLVVELRNEGAEKAGR